VRALRGFTDRRTAGRMLATRVAERDWTSPVVFGLARGGVPVAYEVAMALTAPLGVTVVRKLGAPGHSEFGVGAITPDGPAVYDEGTLAALGLTREDMHAICEREQAEARRRAELYERDRRPTPIDGREVIVCDDGLATGVTARAALRRLREARPRALVFAAPVCAPGAAESLLADADNVVCLASPANFHAVGQFYRDFHQTTDDEVLVLLDAAQRELARSSGGR
jgi:putative phosphoribosyl transferase